MKHLIGYWNMSAKLEPRNDLGEAKRPTTRLSGLGVNPRQQYVLISLIAQLATVSCHAH